MSEHKTQSLYIEFWDGFVELPIDITAESVEQQAKDYAEQRGLEIVDWYVDDATDFDDV